MVRPLEDLFPGLRGTTYRVTSPPDTLYNCIAWAAGDSAQWWWPDPGGRRHWPAEVLREETVTAFQAAFASLGYAPCPGPDPEPGWEKVALFADVAGLPTHMARQLDNGRWTSKLGQREDVEHQLEAVAGEVYGTVVLVLRRPTTSG